MRLLCLYFPRLGIEIALRQSPHLHGRSVALLSEPGADGRVMAVSAKAREHGLLPGMVAGEARRRDRACVFLPGNAGAEIAALERIAAIIRLRATPLVEVGGASHLFIDLTSPGGVYASETAAAHGLRQLAGAWGGVSVRVGAGSTRQAALAAAIREQALPSALDARDPGDEPPVAPFAERSLSIRVRFGGELAATAARARLGQALARLDSILDARNESFRGLRIEVECDGDTQRLTMRFANPVNDAGRALSALESHRCDSRAASEHVVLVTLGRLCPRATPAWGDAAGVASGQQAMPQPGARPRFRQMLLRAAG
ncbi:MAG: hypothetical protein HS107_05775 [Thermoflexaceae bacterium]|nr:hypothetical protein [Thermoflexaceae bacterium]